MEPFVKIQNLEKVYPNGAKAVYDFNLDVNKNEFIVLVGPSGCGKTTTLRMIAGLEDISGGELYINGEYANYKPSKDRKIAIVFQSYALYSQMSVYENIAFPLTVNRYDFPVVDKKLRAVKEAVKLLETVRIEKLFGSIGEAENTKLTHLEPYYFLAEKYGISREGGKELLAYDLLKLEGDVNAQVQKLIADGKAFIAAHMNELEAQGKAVNDDCEFVDELGNVVVERRKPDKFEIRDKVFAAADVLDLGPYLNRLPKELSGGQMQRVALGRAIVKDVPLFLMDEPLSNLDARLRLTMRAEIVRLHKKINTTTIYVTHDQTEAMTMADRIVVMSKGFVQQIDTPERIYNDPRNLFVAKFIGTPAMNMLDGEFDGKSIKAGELDIPLSADNAARLNAFYADTHREFDEVLSAYDGTPKAKEFILNVLSVTDANKTMMSEIKRKGKWAKRIQKLKELFAKKNDVPARDYEKEVLEEKTAELREAVANGKYSLVLGIRPEHVALTVSGAKQTRKTAKGNSFKVKPTLVELLGSDFHVHFDFAGKDMTAVMPAKRKIDENSELELEISLDDVFVFDPISGRRIF